MLIFNPEYTFYKFFDIFNAFDVYHKIIDLKAN